MEKLTKKNGMVIALMGVAILASCVFISLKRVDFIADSIAVSGTVEATGSSGTGDSKEYSVTVSYKDPAGNSRTSKITGSSNVKFLQRGEVLALRYVPDSPDSIVIDSIWELWGTAIMVGAVGLVFLIGGVRVLIKAT
jgi:hypothetical protein